MHPRESPVLRREGLLLVAKEDAKDYSKEVDVEQEELNKIGSGLRFVHV